MNHRAEWLRLEEEIERCDRELQELEREDERRQRAHEERLAEIQRELDELQRPRKSRCTKETVVAVPEELFIWVEVQDNRVDPKSHELDGLQQPRTLLCDEERKSDQKTNTDEVQDNLVDCENAHERELSIMELYEKIVQPLWEGIIASDNEHLVEETATASSIVSIVRIQPQSRIRQRRHIRRVRRTVRSRQKPRSRAIQNFALKRDLSSTPPRSSERWKETTTTTGQLRRFSPAMRRFQSSARRPRPPPMPPPFRSDNVSLLG